MKTKFLFPYQTRYVGYICIVAHVPVALIWGMAHINPDNNNNGVFSSGHLFFMATALLMLIGLFLVAFSKEKIEDEQITQLRTDTLQWAIYLNYIILIASLAFTSSADFRDILHLNLWVPLAFFIIAFRWRIYRLNQGLN